MRKQTTKKVNSFNKDIMFLNGNYLLGVLTCIPHLTPLTLNFSQEAT